MEKEIGSEPEKIRGIESDQTEKGIQSPHAPLHATFIMENLMYKNLEKEADKKVLCLICLHLMTLGLLIVVVCVVCVTLGDASTLLSDAHTTLEDLALMLPEAKKALVILENICEDPLWKVHC